MAHATFPSKLIGPKIKRAMENTEKDADNFDDTRDDLQMMYELALASQKITLTHQEYAFILAWEQK